MEQKQNDQVVYFEINTSFQKLKMYMNQLTDSTLIQFCKIWKHEKGAKKLIQLAIQGDKLLTRQSKNFKKYVKVQKDELNSQLQALKFNEEAKLNHQAVSLEKKEEPEIKQEEQEKMQFLNVNIQKQSQENAIQVKKQDAQEQQLDIQFGQGQGGLFLLSEVQVFDHFIKKEQRKAKQYMRGPYRNYSVDIKKKMVQLYKQEHIPISKLSSQYGIPIKNIKRWADFGIERKEGAGRRRMDPSLQSQLYNKIRDTYPLNSSIQIQSIRTLALNLSKIGDFKASKGWVISFIERNLLSQIYTIV